MLIRCTTCKARRALAASILLGALSCESDPDEVEAAAEDDGAAGAQDGTGAGAGGAVSVVFPSAGVASDGTGGAPARDALVDGCADLDTDGIADCDVTLLENGSFDEDTDGWIPAETTALAWDEANALADFPSGSAKISSEGARADALQCVAIGGDQLVIAYASARVESDAASDDLAQALLEVSFFESDDCTGTFLGFFETPPTVLGEWTTIHAGALLPPETASVAVALVGIKPSSASEFAAYFDNVMLSAREP